MKCWEFRAAIDALPCGKRLPGAVYPPFSDAGGDPDFKRIYGFITLADGKDLGSVLVQQGLARAKGIISTMMERTAA